MTEFLAEIAGVPPSVAVRAKQLAKSIDFDPVDRPSERSRTLEAYSMVAERLIWLSRSTIDEASMTTFLLTLKSKLKTSIAQNEQGDGPAQQAAKTVVAGRRRQPPSPEGAEEEESPALVHEVSARNGDADHTASGERVGRSRPSSARRSLLAAPSLGQQAASRTPVNDGGGTGIDFHGNGDNTGGNDAGDINESNGGHGNLDDGNAVGETSGDNGNVVDGLDSDESMGGHGNASKRPRYTSAYSGTPALSSSTCTASRASTSSILSPVSSARYSSNIPAIGASFLAPKRATDKRLPNIGTSKAADIGQDTVLRDREHDSATPTTSHVRTSPDRCMQHAASPLPAGGPSCPQDTENSSASTPVSPPSIEVPRDAVCQPPANGRLSLGEALVLTLDGGSLPTAASALLSLAEAAYA